MPDMNKIYKMLSWKNSFEVQSEGIKLAREINDLSLLIQPPVDPSVWEHCAKILCEKTDAELEPYLDGLLEWLQDLNWPGALTIVERLKTFSGKKLKQPLEKAIIKSNTMYNNEGLMWRDYLSELLDNSELVSILPEEIFSLLKKHYHNWGNWYSE